MTTTENWLLTSQFPWIRYRTRLDLQEDNLNSKDMVDDYQLMIGHELVTNMLIDLQAWPGKTMKRHNDAALLYHKLVFLAELGISKDQTELIQVFKKIFCYISSDGPIQILGNIPKVFGGNDKDQMMWMLCDAPLLNYALAKFGFQDDERIQKSVDYLLGLVQGNGWPCAATSELGMFKGPGKRIDPCPYANLIMLRLLSAFPELRNSKEAQYGIDMLLDQWQYRKNKKYFLFGMGTDFCKLKAPFIWFDILHVADVLSNFSQCYEDSRFKEMLNIIAAKRDQNGLYKAESVFRAWNNWDFGQKKETSPWITLKVNTIFKKVNYENTNKG